MTIIQMPLSSYPPAWMDEQGVKCKGLTTFFYPNNPSSEVAQAKAVCNGLDGLAACPFRDACLKYAIVNHEGFGVWGGTSERDRRKIQRARNRFKNNHIFNMEDVRFPRAMVVKRQRVLMVQRRKTVMLEQNAC